MGMNIDVAELAGVIAECGLYGVFLTLVCVALYGLKQRKSHSMRLNWPMGLAGGLLIVLATARLTVDTANVFVAFISHNTRQERILYLIDVTQPLFTTKHSILICVLLVGDSFVNWRCWVVWGKNIYVVLLPITMSFASAATGSYTMWAYSNLPNQTVLSEKHWLTSFFVLSLLANAMSTSLLAFRIWSVDRQTTNLVGNRQWSFLPVVRILLESGMLNAAYLFVYTMTLVYGSQGLEIMSELATPLTGIIFTIVIVRVALHSQPDTYWSTAGTKTTINTNNTLVFARPGGTKLASTLKSTQRGDVESGWEMDGVSDTATKKPPAL